MKYKKRLGLPGAVAAGLLLFAAGSGVKAQEIDAIGYVRADIYDNIAGTSVEAGRTTPAYASRSKDRVRYLPALSFGEPSFGGTYGDNYFVHIEGTITPLDSGNYHFFIRSDDASEFHLNPDGAAIPDPNMEVPQAEETGCCAAFQEPGDPRTSELIPLTAGTSYGFAFVVKEGTGDDWGQVAWRREGDTTPAAQLQPIQGVVLGGKADPTGATLSITRQPESQTVDANERAELTVEVAASNPLSVPPVYQWRKNGAPIAGENSPSLVFPLTALSDAGTYSVQVFLLGLNVTSQDAVLAVNPDTTPPTVSSVSQTDETFTRVTVAFSEPVSSPTATTPGNYSLDQGVTVSAAVLSADSLSVTLTTSLLAEGLEYLLTVNNVQDGAGNPIAANTQMSLRTHVFMPGAIVHKKYDNFDDNTGGNPDNLFNDPRYGQPPDRVDIMARWEYPANGAGRVAADPTRNYFDVLEGYFIPPTTGNYVFLTAGADRWWLYLSTDESPANKKLIAAEPGGWSDPRGWTQAHLGSLESRRSDLYAATQWPELDIHLTAGQRYYMLEVHHDPSWCGADDFSATYIMQGDPDPANGSAPTITGSVVGAYVDPSQSEITITEQPADTTQEEGRTAVFAISATATSAYGGAIAYQWQRQAPGGGAWTDLAGATAASYETPPVTLADNGATYRVACSVAGLLVHSEEATLTVLTDVAGPTLVGAGAVASTTGTTSDVGVSFNEALDPVSAGTQANYSLSAGSITGIRFYAGSPGVVLTVAGLTVGNTYTVTVSNVKDLSGNVMTAASLNFAVSAMKWGVVGGNELALGNGVLATAEDGFDVYSDGIGEWGTYDEATFVYEEITGDFDKVLRVEYQDASSQWARAGLVARDVTNFGVGRTAQVGGLAGRYQKVHVNPVLTAMGTAGFNSYEGNRRLATGAETTTAGGGGLPQYPNAWCRLKRAADLFTIFRSDDGVTWTQLGTTTFNEPMPATVYVGPEYSPENGNIPEDSGLRATWVAKFRDYGDYGAVVIPTVGVSAAGVITYTGVLQSSETVNGTYTPVTSATSPYTVPKTGPGRFYRTASQ